MRLKISTYIQDTILTLKLFFFVYAYNLTILEWLKLTKCVRKVLPVDTDTVLAEQVCIRSRN